jgi:hypothetical protein
MLRFFLYKWWAMRYPSNSKIMLADFRDVVFQSNPFKYHHKEWFPSHQLAVFLEAHPAKVIGRDVFNSGWIRSCYGQEGLEVIGTFTASCAGISMGTRDAVLVYTHLLLTQLDPTNRYNFQANPPVNPPANHNGCISLGMDQGFHNWLLYSGILGRYMNVKVFPNGEHAVMSVGAFRGKRAPIQWDLVKWGLLRGSEETSFWVHNWSGDKSPVVHQLSHWGDVVTPRSMGAVQGL